MILHTEQAAGRERDGAARGWRGLAREQQRMSAKASTDPATFPATLTSAPSAAARRVGQRGPCAWQRERTRGEEGGGGGERTGAKCEAHHELVELPAPETSQPNASANQPDA